MAPTESTSSLSPLAVIREAIKHVPAVRYALGVAGVAAAVALVDVFVRDTKSGLLFSIIVAAGMVVLYVFSTLVVSGGVSVMLAGHVLIWSVILPFAVLLGASTWAAIDGRPCNWAEVLALKPHPSCARDISARAPDGGFAGQKQQQEIPRKQEESRQQETPVSGNWVAVTGQFLTTTSRSRPEELAKQTAQALQRAGRNERVEIWRGTTGGAERNIVLVKTTSQSDASKVAEIMRNAGVGNSDATARQSSGWTTVTSCTPSGCNW